MTAPVWAQSLSISAGKLFLLVWTAKHSLQDKPLCGSSFGLRARWWRMAGHVSLPLQSASGLGPHLASPENSCPPEVTRINKENLFTSVKLPTLSKKLFWLILISFFFFCFDNDLITTSLDQKHKLFLCASYFENTLLAFIICLCSLKIYFVSFSQTNPSAFWQGWDSYLQFSCCVKQCLGKNNLVYSGHIHLFNWGCQT